MYTPLCRSSSRPPRLAFVFRARGVSRVPAHLALGVRPQIPECLHLRRLSIKPPAKQPLRRPIRCEKNFRIPPSRTPAQEILVPLFPGPPVASARVFIYVIYSENRPTLPPPNQNLHPISPFNCPAGIRLGSFLKKKTIPYYEKGPRKDVFRSKEYELC